MKKIKYKSKYIKYILILFFMFVSVNFNLTAFAWTPPSETPLGQKLHPRIFLLDENYKATHPDSFGLTVSEIHSRIKNDSAYKTLFQNFVNMVDNEYDEAVNSQGALNSSYNAINLAFLYIINPQILSQSPCNISFNHTKNEYGDRAIEYAMHIATEQKKMTSVEGYPSWADYRTFDYSGNQGYGAINLAQAIVNDWVHDRVTKQNRQFMLDGIINAYTYRYPNDKITLFAEGKHYGVIYNGAIGALGFYGDNLDSFYVNKINEFFDKFEAWWLKSLIQLHNKVFTNGSFSFQGTLYNRISMKNLMIGTLAMSSVLDKNYLNILTYTKFLPYHRIYSVNPMPQGNTYYEIGVHDVGPKNMKILKEYGKYKIEFNPIDYALNLAGEKNLAGLHKWYKEESGFLTGHEGNNRYGMLVYEILFDDAHVTSKSPDEISLPLAKNVGNGKYFLRSGFTKKSDTLITFNARKWHTNDGGHAHRDFAAFEIYKYGDLTTRRTIAKDFAGSGKKALTMRNMWYNTIGVYKQDELDSKGFNTMGYRGGYDNNEIDPDASVWQENGSNHVGNIIAEDINSNRSNPKDYDYIAYDYSNAWSDDKVDYAEREFVYLRSNGGINDEYVVVFDRINALQPQYTKYWLLQSPFTPKLLDNANNEVIMTAEDYPNDPDTSGGRWVNKNSSPTQNNIIQLTNNYSENNSHGVLYNKTLLPDSFQINKTGGPDHYWEDANGKTVATADGDGSLTEREKNYHGTYTMQIQSTTGKKYDTFLNVMQFGDKNTLDRMNQVKKITTESGNMAGAIILDQGKNRIVLFNTAKSSVIKKVAPPISYTISTTAPSSHLLFNTLPNTQYQITRDNNTFTVISNEIGIIRFEDSKVGTNIRYFIDMPGEAPKDISPPSDESSSEEPPEDNSQDTDTTPPAPVELTGATVKDANKVVLTWKANSETDLDEYYIYYGTSSRVYKPYIPAGKVTSFTLSGLEEGKTYYFTITAVDTSGNESGYSNEIKKKIEPVNDDNTNDDIKSDYLFSWKCENNIAKRGDGTTIVGTHGSNNSENPYVDGYDGKSFHNDGNSGYRFCWFPVNNNDIVNPEKGSISFWFNARKLISGYLFGFGNGSDYITGKMKVSGNKFSVFVASRWGNSKIYTSNSDVLLDINTWHHMKYEWEKGGQLKLYIDNKLIDEDDQKGTWGSAPINKLYFGAAFNGYGSSDVLIDKVLITSKSQQNVQLPTDIDNNTTSSDNNVVHLFSWECENNIAKRGDGTTIVGTHGSNNSENPYINGYDGKSFHNDGNSGYRFCWFQVNNNDIVNPEKGSISFWFNARKLISGYLFGFGNGSDYITGKMKVSGNKFSVFVASRWGNSKIYTGNSDVLLDINTWHHMKYEWEKGGQLKLYIDNKLIDEDDQKGTWGSAPINKLYFGAAFNGYGSSDVLIDKVIITH